MLISASLFVKKIFMYSFSVLCKRILASVLSGPKRTRICNPPQNALTMHLPLQDAFHQWVKCDCWFLEPTLCETD